MEKIGSLAELVFASSVTDWQNKENLESSALSKAHVKGLEKTLHIFKEVGKSNDIDLILQVEKAQIGLEKSNYQERDPSVLPSLNAATLDFTVINKSLCAVRSADYNQVDNAYHIKRKTRGVPVDGFHEAVNSHVTRLGNRMSAVGISVPEKNVLRQRQANMRTAKNLYIGLQCKALGIEHPTKGKGLEL